MEPEGAPAPAKPAARNVDDELEDLDNILGKLKGGGIVLDEKPLPGEADGFEDEDEELRDFLRSRGMGGDDDTDLNDDLDDLLGDGSDPIPGVFTGPRPRRQRRGAGFLKFLTIVFLVMWPLGVGGYFARTYIVQWVPATAALYALMNIPVEGVNEDFSFKNVLSTMELAGDGRVLVVRGLISNDSPENKELPNLRLYVVDENNQILGQVVAPPPQAVLAAGSQVPFEIRMENPSQMARNMRVEVVPRD
jgi:hypothetical protein